MQDKYFWDSNLWVYLFIQSADPQDINKKRKLQSIIAQGIDIVVSVQVLNETANVLMRTYGYDETQTKIFIQSIIRLTTVIPLISDFTLQGLDLKIKYTFSWFDSLILAAALDSACIYLYSEDMHDGLVVNKQLTIVNPFKLP